MSAGIQCLSHTKELVSHFLDDKYVSELNRDNPLGMQGQIAEQFAKLVKALWSGKFSHVVPREFKATLEKFAPQFVGTMQHDSQELLAFLLDGLHEDLNRVMKKPYVEVPDGTNNANDEQLAALSWEGYRKRNSSHIVDLFQGQLKSRLECPRCETFSVTFDPFMYLSLPLPTPTTTCVKLCFIPADPNLPAQNLRIDVPKSALMRDVMLKVAQQTSTRACRLILADVLHSKIFGYVDPAASVDFARDETYYAFELTHRIVKIYRNALVVVEDNTENGEAAEDSIAQEEQKEYKGYQQKRYDVHAPTRPYNEPPIQKTVTVACVALQKEAVTKSYYSYSSYSTYSAIGFPVLVCVPVGANMNELIDIITARFARVCDRNVLRQSLVASLGFLTPQLPPSTTVTDSTSESSLSEQVSSATPLNDNLLGSNNTSPALSPSPAPLTTTTIATTTAYPSTPTALVTTSTESIELAQEPNPADESTTVSGASELDSNNQDTAPPPPTLIVKFELTDQSSVLPWGTTSRPYYSYNNSYNSSAPEEKITDLVTGFRLPDPATIVIKISNGSELIDDKMLSVPKAVEQTTASMSLTDCLTSFSQLETLGEEDKWYCGKCKEHVMASKKFDIWKHSDLLIFQLKRFSYDRHFRDKIEDLIDFPISGLDMSAHVIGPHEQPLLYDLYAVVNHYGGLGGGHYTAFCQHHTSGKWYHFDDSLCSPITEEEIKTTAAYVLFYRKREPVTPSSDMTDDV
eukprot:c9622_g2_i1.p1 GENE.c9622_g2_i1~~c9622_g2_i1.p1  ORF type:complete len:861 (-),score=224.95 c9622_g2_i1:116-2350(-)